jgi:protein TonB
MIDPGASGNESAGERVSRLPPIGFWSYSRQDDELSKGKLSLLRSLLMSEIQQLFGRERVQLFQDVSAIPHGASWEREIRTSLANSTFFVPILTPNFVQSEWCAREVAIFVERERELFETYPGLPRRSRIFPLLLIDIAGVEPADDAVLRGLESLQWFDFRRLRHRNYDDESVQQALSEFAASIRDLLYLKILPPDIGHEPRSVAQAIPEVTRPAPAVATSPRLPLHARVAEALEQESTAHEPARFRSRRTIAAGAAAGVAVVFAATAWFLSAPAEPDALAPIPAENSMAALQPPATESPPVPGAGQEQAGTRVSPESARGAQPAPVPVEPRRPSRSPLATGGAAPRGEDPGAPAAMPAATPARLISGAVSNDDYPAEALRSGAQGSVAARITIGPAGRVNSCSIERSSGNAMLDSVTCRLFQVRYRFAPARDARGNPVSESRTQVLTWRLPAAPAAAR